MRLIDADKVIQSVDRQITISRMLLGNDPQAQEFVSIAEQSIKQEISNAPTEKAIPIEWLINKCNEADNMGWGIDDWSEKDCYIYVFEQWEKENEHKESD